MRTPPGDFIAQLPKAELHLHLEGAVSPALLAELADRHATEYAGAAGRQLREDLYAFGDFYAFLEAYKLVCRHLRTPDDYLKVFETLEAYFLRENILYAEVLYTPSIPWKFGGDGREILTALLEASARFQAQSGVEVRWILDNVRQFGPSAAERTAEMAAEFHAAGVVGIGLGGDEKSIDAREFEEVFNWARAHQLFAHVHAGEIGGPEEVWDAVQILGANRIGHGIQAARDSRLMQYLKDHVIALDLCLTSNQRTRAWSMLGEHPGKLLVKRGVPVTFNTDDPGLFQTGLSAEYRKAAQAFDLDAGALTRTALQGIHSAFLPHAEKMRLMEVFQTRIGALDPLSR